MGGEKPGVGGCGLLELHGKQGLRFEEMAYAAEVVLTMGGVKKLFEEGYWKWIEEVREFCHPLEGLSLKQCGIRHHSVHLVDP